MKRVYERKGAYANPVDGSRNEVRGVSVQLIPLHNPSSEKTKDEVVGAKVTALAAWSGGQRESR